MSAKLRLGLLAGFLAVCLIVFGVWRPIDEQQLRDWIGGAGPFAPLVFIALAIVLGNLMVPGLLLSLAAGLLFGPLYGTLVAITSATGCAVLGLLLGRRIGRDGVAELGGVRLERTMKLLERYGLWAVVLQRLFPGVPDGPSSYAFGALGVHVWQIAVGTLIGSLPRAFSYAALGSAAGNLDPVLGAVGASVLLLAGVVGSVLGGRVALAERRRARLTRSDEN